jgi:hypothetical protein
MIEELFDSAGEHRTLEKGEATLIYKMDLLDYYRGWGYLGDGDGNITSNLVYLPLEGTEYIYNRSLKCTDILMNKTKALSSWVDNTGRELNRICIVTYTWTNSGRLVDTPRANSAASWKLRFSYDMDIKDQDYFIDLNQMDAHPADPTQFIIDKENYYYTQVYGTEWTDKTTAADKNEFRDDHAVPPLEFRSSNYKFHFTFYTDRLLPLSSYMCTVNSNNFISLLYAQRDLALQYQGKQNSYVSNTENIDDAEHWMLISVEDNRNFEKGTQFFEYNLTWEWNPFGWNNWQVIKDYTGGVATHIPCVQYELSEFYNIVDGIDNTNVLPEYEF